MASFTSNVVVTPASEYARKRASELGLRLSSAYRSPAKDKQVGGSGKGDHTKGLAYDFYGSYSAMSKFAHEMKASGLFRWIGWVEFGVKDHADHVHVSWYADMSKYKDVMPPNASYGEKGEIIETIQKLLGGLKVDGFFGEKTEQAVKEFQEKHNLSIDGIVGKNTWEELTKGGTSFFS